MKACGTSTMGWDAQLGFRASHYLPSLERIRCWVRELSLEITLSTQLIVFIKSFEIVKLQRKF